MSAFTPILMQNDGTTHVGRLTDCLTCVVTESLNDDQYELSITYPLADRLADEMLVDRVIVAKPNQSDNAQPFRIYKTTKDLSNSTIAVEATHCALHALHNYVAMLGSVCGTVDQVCETIAETAIIDSGTLPFTFYSDVEEAATLDWQVPTTLFDILFDAENGLIAKFGCQIKYNGYQIRLLQSRGSDNGVAIRAGANMSSLNVVADASEVITGIIPYYAVEDEDGVVTVVTAENPVIAYSDHDVCYDHLLPIDCTSDIEKPQWAQDDWLPEPSTIEEWGREYLAVNYDGYIPVTYAAGVVSDASSATGAMAIGDIVLLLSERVNTRIKARIVSTEYDCLSDSYNSVGIGSVRSNLAQTIVDMTDTKPVITKVTKTVTGGHNGSWSWSFNHSITLCHAWYKSPHKATCTTYASGHRYKSGKITIPLPSDLDYVDEWTSSFDGSFTDNNGATVTVTIHNIGVDGIDIYLYSSVRGDVAGTLYIDGNFSDGAVPGNILNDQVTWTPTAARYLYSYTRPAGRIAIVKSGEAQACVGYYDGCCLIAYPYNKSYYRIGWSNQDVPESTPSDQSVSWLSSSKVILYSGSDLKTKTCTVPANTTCKCIGTLDGCYVVLYQYGNHFYCGMTTVNGGVKLGG